MINPDDYALIAEALRMAAADHLDVALRNRHVDIAACGVALRKQMRCMRIAEIFERLAGAQVPTLTDVSMEQTHD